MTRKQIIVLVSSIAIALIAIVIFVFVLLYTAKLESEDPKLGHVNTESVTPTPAPLAPTTAPDDNYHHYDEAEKKKIDTLYPVDPSIVADEELEDYYDSRYRQAVTIINKYPEYNFDIDEVIEYITPTVNNDPVILNDTNTVIGLDENSDLSSGLSEFYITAEQPATQPEGTNPIERAYALYGNDMDRNTNIIDISKYHWIRLTSTDYFQLQNLPIDERPVVFSNSGKPCRYIDQQNLNLAEVLMDDPSE